MIGIRYEHKEKALLILCSSRSGTAKAEISFRASQFQSASWRREGAGNGIACQVLSESTHRCRAVQRRKDTCVYRHAVKSKRCYHTYPLLGIVDPELRLA